MKKIIYLILIAHSTLTMDPQSSVLCQVNQDWVARYNGPGNGWDEGYSMAVDGSGNVFVTGWIYGSGTNYDYATIKYNSSGVQQWLQTYNTPGNDEDDAYSIAVDVSGNVYVTGESWETEPYSDYATLKYNSSGVQQWVQRYNGPGNSYDGAYSMTIDGLGNVYVTGYSWAPLSDYATIKYNSSGVQQWLMRYNGPGNDDDGGNSIAVDGSGNVYVTGRSTGSGTDLDYVTIKYNSSGVQQWVQRYNGPANGYDEALSIALDASANVYVTGSSQGSGTASDYATIKYNSSGVQQWEVRYNGPGNGRELAYAMAVDGSGNVFVTGMSFGSGTGSDYATIKYSSSGVQQWVQRYNGPGNGGDTARSMALDDSGNVYVTGRSLGSGTGLDYATIRYSSSGVQQWLMRYNGPGNGDDGGNSIAVDGSGNVYVTGGSLGGGTGLDYATIKYSQTVGITPISNQIPETFRLYQNYPNPFNPSTIIKFDIPANLQSEICILKMFDILGREAGILVNEELKPGTYEIEFNAGSHPSGIYYYTITAGEFRETRKAVLVK